MILDTGSSRTILAGTLARRLRLASSGMSTLNTPAAPLEVPVGRLRDLRVEGSGLAASDLEVFWVDLAGMSSGAVEGILGQDFLHKFRLLIDYRGRRLVFEPSREQMEKLVGEPVPVSRTRAGLLVPAHFQGDPDRNLRLVLDTGSDSIVLYGSQQMQGTNRKPRGAGGAFLKGVDGRHSRVVSLDRIHLQVGQFVTSGAGGYLLEHQPAGPYVHGLLPARLFDSIYIDPENDFILLNPIRLGAAPE